MVKSDDYDVTVIACAQIPYATVIASSEPVVVGETVTVTCLAGFEFVNNMSATTFTCTEDMTFTPAEEPQCQGRCLIYHFKRINSKP